MRRLLPLALAALSLPAALAAPAVAAPAAESVTGELSVLHVDDLARGTAREQLMLDTGDRTYRVTGAPGDEALAGRRVRVEGDPDAAVLDGPVEPVAGRSARAAGAAATAPGERRVAVLLAAAADEVQWDREEVRRTMFGDGASVATLFATQSQGRTTVTGDVFGWYTVTADRAACDHTAIGTQAEAAATAEGVDLAAYDHVMVVFPRRASCGFSGLGQMPGRRTWITGRYVSPLVMAHELGHNLGANHAASTACTSDGGAPVSLSPTCAVAEYGDPYSVMGNLRTRLMSNWHRVEVGHLPADEGRTVERDGTYALASVNAAGPATKLLRVRRRVPGAPRTEDLSLELRTPLAPFDAFAEGEPVTAGVSVRRTAPPGLRVRTELVDATPGSAGGTTDAPLAPGAALEDAPSGLTLRVESVAGGVAQVRVGYAPTAPGRPAASARPGALTLRWAASADDTAVAGYRLERDGVEVASVAGTEAVERDLEPYRTYTYRVVALDAAGNRAVSEPLVVAGPPAPAPAAEAPAAPPAASASGPVTVPPVASSGPLRPTATSLALVTPRAGRRLPRDRRLVLALRGRAVPLTARLGGRPVRVTRRGTRVVVALPVRARTGRHRLVLAGGGRTLLTLRLAGGVVRPG